MEVYDPVGRRLTIAFPLTSSQWGDMKPFPLPEAAALSDGSRGKKES